MYSRPKQNPNATFRIPENYRGTAFSEEDSGRAFEQTSSDGGSLTGETSEAWESTSEKTSEKTSLSYALQENPATETKASSAYPSLLPPKRSATRGGIPGESGMEELLILGILFLLSQSEAEDDVLPLLILLLFYK